MSALIIGMAPVVGRRFRMSLRSERLQEFEEGGAVGSGHVAEGFFGCVGFAAVPQDSFFEGASPAVVEIRLAAAYTRS